MPLLRLCLLTLLLPTIPCLAEGASKSREPILDMHLHARHADYMGPEPPPMCAPFEVMPR